MIIATALFGDVDIAEEDVYTFPGGVPGFENANRFALIKQHPDEPFIYLQSTEAPSLSFILADPFVFVPDYDFEIREHLVEELRIDDLSDIAVWSIATVNDTFTEATINLMAPILLNKKHRLGKQAILHDTSYPVRHRILSANDELKEEDSIC
jgi:flagellar assembly factor FliW